MVLRKLAPGLPLLAIAALCFAFGGARAFDSTASPTGGGVAGAPAEEPQITGTIRGTYHLGFSEYLQTYDEVTTAKIVWKEGPDTPGCHCREFFPAEEDQPDDSGIDWTFDYAVDSSGEICTDTAGGHKEAGADLLLPEEQMIILWEDPNDDTQYYFSGNGAIHDEGFIDCDGGFSVEPIPFLDVSAPDIELPTPTFPALAAGSASIPSCDAPVKVARDATGIHGSCYDLYIADDYSLEYLKYEWELELAPEPIVFIHGFLGSRMSCGGDELWPNIPPGPELSQMKLGADGVAPGPGACAPTVGEVVDDVPGKDIYGKTMDFLNELAPGRVYFLEWDWRKGPEQSLAALDSKIGFARSEHDNAKVVIMAHSYGGLLARLYLADAGRAENVARVVTIGTPAWGSPKALFPLYAGVETPEFSPLDLLIDNDDLKEFARNLTGAYFLYPSASYGPWLILGESPAPFVNQQGLLDYVTSLGGNAALLSQALGLHASTLDQPYISGPDDPKFEVIVGTGVATISGVQVLPGGKVSITYENGDETVPGRSAARGVLGAGNPNKSRTHYSCGVKHVDLPGHQQITDAIEAFLKFGEEIEGLDSPCTAYGLETKVFPTSLLGRESAGGLEPAGVSPQGAAMSIEDAVLQGVVDYLDLPDEKFIISGPELPEIALPQGTFLQVTPLTDGARGQPLMYGPLAGQITMSAGPGGPVVLVDGAPAPLYGDVDCSNTVTVIDALLLVLAAGGAPKPQPDGCPAIGSGAGPHGDFDCDTLITGSDGVGVLEVVAGVSHGFSANCG